jgi:hypothetical protein
MLDVVAFDPILLITTRLFTLQLFDRYNWSVTSRRSQSVYFLTLPTYLSMYRTCIEGIVIRTLLLAHSVHIVLRIIVFVSDTVCRI